jgi:hypothetical protein
MTKCTICLEKFRLNDSIISCHCVSLIHDRCYTSWKNVQNPAVNYSACPYCNRIGVLYTDTYDCIDMIPTCIKKLLHINNRPIITDTNNELTDNN